jgi:predicted O-linked N-acetylglucosamine transferase (SPINDLY family)
MNGNAPQPPGSPDIASALRKARTLHQQERLAGAEALYEGILKHDPHHFDALCLLGVIEAQRQNFDAAILRFRKALPLNPNCGPLHSSMGNALLSMRRYSEAVASFDRALAIDPAHFEVLNNRGNALFELKRSDEALASYNRALAVRPEAAEILHNRGNVLQQLGRNDEALADYDRALAIRPAYPEALHKRGAVLRELKRHDEALASYDRALAIKPDYADALCDRGNALLQINRPLEAIAGYDRALAAKPRFADAHYNRGLALSALARHAEAVCEFARVLSIEPNFAYARGELLYAQLHCCDWTGYARLVEQIENDVIAGKRAATPFVFLCVSESPATQRKCATIYSKDRCAAPMRALWTGERYRHDKVRVAYISADFHNHATAYLAAELFEKHDRSRYETYAISLGPNQKDEWRMRLENAFTHFVDVRGRGDREVALLLRSLEIDIAVDLKGHTQHSRPRILAFRPAPIQVNYLGFPGTMGADFIDYIIADRFTIPEAERSCYAEQVVYLPDVYQPNDSTRRISEHAPTRCEAGLPETGFVFCSFVSGYKIAPPVFDSWMRLLAKVEGSVLWLLAGDADAVGNLRRSAQLRGIAPERLLFAPRTKLEHHLARHRLADLFLDTLPINAHTTASDALWAGVPIVTRLGRGFAGRVAASLLNALGLPELITEDLEEYEALALHLAQSTDRLAALRAKLATNRASYPLFDTDRLRRHIEIAFETMSVRCQRGERPAGFAVASSGHSERR